MKDLKLGQSIRFKAIDEFVGKEIILEGIVIGNHKNVRTCWPVEMAEARKGIYLVVVQNRKNRLYAVNDDEVLLESINVVNRNKEVNQHTKKRAS